MALMQIAEPGRSTAPHQHKRAAGIDLGTTHSLVASVRSGTPQVLEDEQGNRLLPSVVHYLPDHSTTGSTAMEQAATDPKNVIVSVKRFMGRSKDDIGFSHPYQLSATEKEMPAFETAQGRKTPVEVSADLLQQLKQTASRNLGGDLSGVVITVPAYYDEAQRQATRDAASLAGLHVYRLINEPTAAAVAYGFADNPDKEGQVQLVFDLGGGTFDVTLLKSHAGVLQVLSTAGHPQLGGDDIDRLLAQWIVKQSGHKAETPSDLRYLLTAARQLKHQLTDQPIATTRYKDWEGQLNREEFDGLIQPVIERCLTICKRAMDDAGLTADQINDVILVGGATRVPALQKAVGERFGKTPLCSINPDEVVALGAAITADQIAGNRPDGTVLLDVTPLSLGIETMGGLTECLIPRNTPIPVTRQQEFTTFKDGQTRMMIHVVQGERELAEKNRSLARFVLSDIPPLLAGVARIEITYHVDADGLLTVSAREKETGKDARVEIRPSYGLSQEDTERLLEEGYRHAREDAEARSYNELEVEARRDIEAVESALRHQAEQLDKDLQERLKNASTALETALSSHDPQAIRQARDILKQQSDEAAQILMDASVNHALQGTRLDQWS